MAEKRLIVKLRADREKRILRGIPTLETKD
jgi:hypothetical protein